MSDWKKQLSPAERRIKARRVRAMVRGYKSATEAAHAHHISRAYVYHIIKQLEQWESEVSFDDEAAEINAQFPKYHPMKWMLASGRLILAYIRGSVSAELLGGVTELGPRVLSS